MTEMDDLYRVRNHAIDMEDLETANNAQGKIDIALGQTGIDATLEGEVGPLDELQSAGANDLTPDMIQRAINLLDPNSDDAASDAEIVLGYAVFGQSENPESQEWSHIVERAQKVYRHRVGSPSSLS